MAAYTKTYSVFEAIREQLLDQMGEELDDVVIYDGPLQTAIDDHFGQAGSASPKAFVFFGMATDTPDNLTGGGGPVRAGINVDFYVAVRATGRSRYSSDLERLYGLSDLIEFVAFDPANWVTTMQTRVGAVAFQFRQRTVTSSDLFVHQVRFVFRPSRVT